MIFIIKLVLLLINIIICFYLFSLFCGGVIEMAKSIFEIFLTAYLFIIIPTTIVFSLISIFTGILIYGIILKSDISIFNKIMLISLNMLPMFDLIAILIMKDRKNNKWIKQIFKNTYILIYKLQILNDKKRANNYFNRRFQLLLRGKAQSRCRSAGSDSVVFCMERLFQYNAEDSYPVFPIP